MWLRDFDGSNIYNGEIDIMENVGYTPNVTYATVHCLDQKSHTVGSVSGYGQFNNDGRTYHLFAADWNSNRIKFYLDNQLIYQVHKARMPKKCMWSFDTYLNLIVNTAIGGTWGGKPTATFPVYYYVDYIRQYASVGV